MDIEATKRRCELACCFSEDEDTNLAVSLAIHDLPDAIELIEEMAGVLGDVGDKLAGCDGLAWARRCDAVLAKVRPK